MRQHAFKEGSQRVLENTSLSRVLGRVLRSCLAAGPEGRGFSEGFLRRVLGRGQKVIRRQKHTLFVEYDPPKREPYWLWFLFLEESFRRFRLPVPVILLVILPCAFCL